MGRPQQVSAQRRSIVRQAAQRLIFSLGLFVVLLGVTSYGLYSAALQKMAHERANDLEAFYRARLMQLDRDWDLQTRDFKVRLEVARLLEEKKTSVTNLQAFMTVQGTNRRFQYMLIQNRRGDKVFAFGTDLDLEKIPIPADQENGWYLSPDTGNLFRVYVVPVWLGEARTGRLALFYHIDNALLFNLATPGIVLTARHDGRPVANSAGPAGLGQAKSPAYRDVDADVREISWSADPGDKSSLIIDAPIKALFTRTELMVGAATIPVIDGLILWFTLGFWLMRNTRRISELGGAVGEFTVGRKVTAALDEKLLLARGGQRDEVSEVACAIDDLMHAVMRGDADLAEQMVTLNRLNAELGEFTYVASHDLQEPLRKLMIFSEWLVRDLGGNLPEPVAKDVAFITDAAARMRRLVEDLLVLSRAGNRDLQRERVSLKKVAETALEALALRIGETGAVISRDPLPEVLGDATLLTQLYQNLVSNALKYCDGVPHIHLSVERKNGAWLLGVRDDGIGINPDYAEQIFQPFKRLHGREKYEGTGIGLAICRKVVERHGGKIWVESEEGVGTHFRFTLPG